MSDQNNINSSQYWDNRFESDWESNGGREQSRFFARVAIEALPQWLVHKVRWDNLSVCDWGCAQGDGTETLAQLLSWNVTGIDFSRSAIERAARTHRNARFSHENLLDRPDRPPFDVVFSSNTLEHFVKPWDAFEQISHYASKFIVLLLPYREFDRHIEHEVTFDAPNIPLAPNPDWALVYESVVDTRFREPTYWAGHQILLIYARTAQLGLQRLSLADARRSGVDADDTSTRTKQSLAYVQGEKSRAHQALAQAEKEKWRADEALAQLDAEKLRADHAIAHLETEGLRANRALAQLETEKVRAEQTFAQAEAEKSRADEALAQLDAEKLRADHALAQLEVERSAAKNAKFGLVSASTRMSVLTHECETLRGKLQQLTDEHARLIDATHQRDECIHFLRYRQQSLMTEVTTLLATRSWRWTAPLRVVRGMPDWMRRRLNDVNYAYAHGGVWNVAHRSLAYIPKQMKRRGEIAPAGTMPAGSVARSEPSNPPASPAGITLASKTPRALPDVFVFSIIDWHFRIQRPQHLAREFAQAGHRVYFFSNHFDDAREPGYSIERLDDLLPLYQVRLKVHRAPAIYFAAPTAEAIQQIHAGMRLLLDWSGTDRSWSIIQHGYWYPIATGLQSECLAYDCMDHHEGFGNVPQELLAIEEQMMERADLLVTTSSWLENHARKRNSHVSVIRNAGQYRHFCDAPAERFVDPQGRQIIGYYGAIAEWFDIELVAQIAQSFPDALVLLVGADSAGVGDKLARYPNVQMTGEVPYVKLPYYLYAFEVCLMPFRVIPLTLATNPVKVYEYLGAGRSVVGVDLPEMAQFGDLVRIADTHEGFVGQVRAALAALPDSQEVVARRKAFAAGQTWAHRVADFRNEIQALPRPKVSAIVLTYNNLNLTKDCLDSLERHSDGVDLEIVIVDNASSDGTPAYLSAWAGSRANVKLILNDDNRGFAGGNNQGLAAAMGDYLVILNNDTVVTRGWAMRMTRHLRHNPWLGIIGPVTNNIGNEARVDTLYTGLDAMHIEAQALTDRCLGEWFELDTVAFFCAMLPRSTYERCGPISEDYGVGFFEDDDYCRRVQAAGLRVGCAEDVFVHHHLSASFNKLGEEKKRALFETNRAIYEAKWGPWTPHKYRESRKIVSEDAYV
ncbi:putative glycosyl transferase [Paraburkholderia ribeironis]|uniref:Putative glycosyl transferase n=1 Tax=Paraburkholderia ribeironis TaxID=1247936 RepID=A0A1N7S4J9_9BURK|nr:glycosyltransferase [Paraburkholderia ribeironis]SIT42334.1 putative glycosyl transferase [Paraburkholderia ribeironis]